jgi:hypothetical protein
MQIEQNVVQHLDADAVTEWGQKRIKETIVYSVLFIWANKWDANDSCARIGGPFGGSWYIPPPAPTGATSCCNLHLYYHFCCTQYMQYPTYRILPLSHSFHLKISKFKAWNVPKIRVFQLPMKRCFYCIPDLRFPGMWHSAVCCRVRILRKQSIELQGVAFHKAVILVFVALGITNLTVLSLVASMPSSRTSFNEV